MEEKSTNECKNCSTQVEGQFCHFCGQRYHDHKESFGELAYEFLSDFLHFDSRFFRTVLPLIFQPGKLTKNYNEGKQRSQFHPIRLYLFSSFIYFFLFFYFTNFDNAFESGENNIHPTSFNVDSANLIKTTDSLKHAINTFSDTTVKKKTLSNPAKASSGFVNKNIIAGNDSNDSQFHLAYSADSYIDSLLHNKVTPAEYIKQQNMLSNERKAGYLKRLFTVRLIKINMIGQQGKTELVKKLTESFLHNIPKMLFFLLPVFALLLKLLYIRRKEFYYVDHAVLSLHYFSLIFLLLILSKYILDKIFNTNNFTIIALCWASVYFLLAMKRLYGQKWGKTIFKFMALGILFSFAVLISLLANLAWTSLSI